MKAYELSEEVRKRWVKKRVIDNQDLMALPIRYGGLGIINPSNRQLQSQNKIICIHKIILYNRLLDNLKRLSIGLVT